MNASAGHAFTFSGPGTNFKFGKEKGHRRSLRKEHLRTPQDKKSTPAKQHGIWRKKIHELKAEDKATFYSLVEIKALVLVSKNTEERMYVVDSGASMHMMSKKDLSSDEMDTLRRSRTPTTVVSVRLRNYSMKRQQFYRLVSFAQNTDIHLNGKMAETPRLTKNGKTVT